MKAHPECPCCGGQGHFTTDEPSGYGPSCFVAGQALCVSCDGSGVIAACYDCDAPLQAGDELHELTVGRYSCGRCSRELSAPALSRDTMPCGLPDFDMEEAS